MKVSLYQEIRSDPKEMPREYKIECEIDFIPKSFWASCGISSEVFDSYYDIETKEMTILLKPFEPKAEDFDDFCGGLEEVGWVEIG